MPIVEAGPYTLKSEACKQCAQPIHFVVVLADEHSQGGYIALNARPTTQPPSKKQYIIAAGPGAEPGNFTYVVHFDPSQREDADEPRFTRHDCPLQRGSL